MLPLSLRLAIGGSREALSRLAVIAMGVAIGVAFLLFGISGLNLLYGSSQQSCWQCTGAGPQSFEISKDSHTYPLLWSSTTDYYRGQKIYRYDLAVRDANAGSIPGIPRLPGPGHYYVSPALSKLINSAPANQLRNRFPSHLEGQIGTAGLSSPKDLIVVVGHDPTSFTDYPLVQAKRHVSTAPEHHDYGPFVTTLFGLGVGGLLFAILTLIGTSTRLAAARRAEKLATLRLAGATPRQINRFAAVDAAVSAAVGSVVGFGLFYVLRTIVSHVVSTNLIAFFPDRLNPGWLGAFTVLVGTPCLAALAAIVSLRRVRISPLGIAHRTTPKPPRAWRIAPLAMGLLLVTYAWHTNRHIALSEVRGHMTPYFLIGALLTIVGLVVAGPWLTMVVNKLLAKRTQRASTLLASRRLADNPKAAFRPISVMVVAVFLCTIISMTTPLLITNSQNPKDINNLFSTTEYTATYVDSHWKPMPQTQFNPLRADIERTPGTRVIPIYFTANQNFNTSASNVLVRCADLAHLPTLGRCKPGVNMLQESVGFEFNSIIAGNVPPVSLHMPPGDIQSLVVYSFMIRTDGNPAHIEQLRTSIAKHPTELATGRTWQEQTADTTAAVHAVQALIDAAIVVVLLVAGCSLTVAAAGGLVERKRPLGLLRVSGASLGQLRTVVLYESAVPLLAAAAISAGAASLVARILILSFADRPVSVPPLTTGYYLLIGGGLAGALAILLAILPLLSALTRPTEIRFE